MMRRLAFAALIAAFCALLNCGQPQDAAASVESEDLPLSIVKLPPEVRLRKLHLVRPDLIPYPIAFEVYC